jgi:membrane-bound serine protease (ClpP class)
LVPVVEIPDSINPGTADYLISQIENAERQKSPLLLLRMDTPGGLLSSTREIIQRMLNSPVLIVVFIGPQGAHAGSAGALITLASDVAVMAPSTNIGAAHPVTGNGSDMDKTMAQKVTNDTAAFAEGVAKSKGRNAVWAVKAVKDSASITSEEALKEGVIDFIANDISEIFKKLPGFKLKKAKKYGLNTFESVPTLTFTSRAATMTIKQKLLAFFSDPNLSYLIMSLGGLCLWIELSKKQTEDEKGMHLEILRSNLEKIDNTEIVIVRKVNSSGSLFAQIAEKDIQEEIKNASKILVPIEYIQLSEHIKHTGIHKIILGSKSKLGREYALNLQIKGS